MPAAASSSRRGGPPPRPTSQADPGDQRDDEDHDRDEHEFHAGSLPAHGGDAGGTQERGPVWCHAPARREPPALLLGPLLRHVDPVSATVWVETDRPCVVEVLGRRARTFCVGGHHYALVVVEGLEPGSSTPYEVHLDGEPVWPPAGSQFPPSRIRTPGGGGLPHRVRLLPLREPGHGRGLGEASRRRPGPLRQPHRRPCPRTGGPTRWCCSATRSTPTSSPSRDPVVARRRRRRDKSPDGAAPEDEVADFEEYTRLYAESWGDPQVRWLLSTIPSSMIFDDHEMIDDWNTSAAWRARSPPRAGGPSGSTAAWSATGSTSTWATSAPRSWRRTRPWQAIQELTDSAGRRRRRAGAAGDGRPRRHRAGQHPLELRPALGRRPADHDRQPGRPGARRAAAPDAGRRRVRVGRGGDAPRRSTRAWST